MKIIFSSRKIGIPFEQLNVRDTFLYHGALYMKIKEHELYGFNVVVLDDGEEAGALKICDKNARVQPVNSELICKSNNY